MYIRSKIFLRANGLFFSFLKAIESLNIKEKGKKDKMNNLYFKIVKFKRSNLFDQIE
jgi:hypothetical protein